jgi:hypothetical protein
VAEWVLLIPWLAPGANANQQNQIRAEVGDTMDGIGHNCLAVTQNAGSEL